MRIRSQTEKMGGVTKKKGISMLYLQFYNGNFVNQSYKLFMYSSSSFLFMAN